MNDIKSELLKKKQQLAELKRRKQEREQEKQLKLNATTQTELRTSLASTAANGFNNNHTFFLNPFSEFENLNADEIIAKLRLNDEINKNNKNNKSSTLTPSSSSFSISLSSSNQSITSSATQSTIQNNGRKLRDSNSANRLSSNDLENNEYLNTSRNLDNLKLASEINVVNIFPHETIKYDKETQTASTFEYTGNDSSFADENESTDDGGGGGGSDFNHNSMDNDGRTKKKPKPLAFYEDIFIYDTLQWEDEFTPLDEELNATDINKSIPATSNESMNNSPSRTSHSNLSNKAHRDSGNLDDEEIVNNWQKKKNGEINETKPNRANETNNENIGEFLQQKYPIIERALRQNEKNIFFDYSMLDESEKEKDEENDTIIKFKKSFAATEKWSSAVITCLDWSQLHPELILCSYDNLAFNYEEAGCEAVAVVWNAKSDQKIPQQTFTCTSLITSCVFSPFHPNLVVAGTYSGQIVMWDIRSNKRTPIQRSSLSITSHVNPVYCIRVMGTSTSQNLASISNDGKLCLWSLENLNLPYNTQDIALKTASNRNVYATCFDFQSFDNSSPQQSETNLPTTNNSNSSRFAVVGSEDGLVHTLSIQNANKFSLCDTFDEHIGPITSVSCHSSDNEAYCNEPSLSRLYLSSSFDSTVKLWSNGENPSQIYSFESNGDYVYDVGWSPIHPSLFACVDGTGRLDLWNLNKDFEVASASVEIDNRARALNRLKWSKKGTEIAVGDDHGQVSIYEINENFARPNSDDSRKFLNTLDTLKQLSLETNGFIERHDNFSYFMNSIR